MRKFLSVLSFCACAGRLLAAGDTEWEPASLGYPDRIYLNLFTQHYGIDEKQFGYQGPNEFNPGLGLLWIDYENQFVLSVGAYQDSYKDFAFTAGISRPIYYSDTTLFTVGLSFTASFLGDTKIYRRNKKTGEFYADTVPQRFYVWPYLNLTYKNMFVQWRPGVNKDLEPMGVLSFGLSFTFDDFRASAGKPNWRP